MLTRAFSFWFTLDWFDSETRAGGLRAFDEIAGRSFARTEVLLAFVTLARLGDLVGAVSPSFAAEEAVEAVAAPGRRTGRVGDFGRGFVVGEVGPGFLTALRVGTEAPFSSFVAGALSAFAPAESRLALGTGSFLGSLFTLFGALDEYCCLGDAVFDGAWLPATLGEFGVSGDLPRFSVGAVAVAFGALVTAFLVLMDNGRDEPDALFVGEVLGMDPGLDRLVDAAGLDVLACFGVEGVLPSTTCSWLSSAFEISPDACSKGAPLRIAPRS